MNNFKNDIFIKKAKAIHGDNYCYSLVNYINNETKVKIICKTHGIFEQEPKKHINRSQKCPKCTGHKTDTNSFIEKAKLIHGDYYNYTKVIYKGVNKKVKIICPIHGEFEQTPNNHLANKKCMLCNGTPKKQINEFIFQGKNKHKDKYNYSLVNYINNETKVKIICPIHGEFEQTPAAHLRGQGCPMCNESKGEICVRNYLLENKITFISQKRFNDCRNILPLPFDFYLPDYNICIEFHGHQHYLPNHNFGSKNNEYEKIVLRDKIKFDYCLTNKILLLVISYKDNPIEELSNLLSTYIFK